ncbi:DUF5993 family protein [Burkholderia ubonensis]|uniref:DUF5993 family protein n=1 Tax=Burkholderia ubonensis TaxID=101571 RepID=UPI000B4E6FBE
MFLPFLTALTTAGVAMTGKYRLTLALFILSLVVTLASFAHHATDALNLTF